MVCSKCEKKLDKIITPDVWKDGSRNPPPGKDAGKKLNTNKLLEKKKFSFDPYGSKCKLCKCNVPEKQIYCHSCSYSKGLCSMCGVKVLNTKNYRQSDI